MRIVRLVFVVICFSIILISTIPIVILSEVLLPFDTLVYSNPYESFKDNPSLVEEINIESDIGNIEIIYITQPVAYSVKIDLSIEMGGYDLKGKEVLDFFDIGWQETSSKLNFSLILKDDFLLQDILSLIKKAQIVMSIKASINCDFNVNLQSGYLNLYVPFGASVGNVFTYISNGDIQYEFYKCHVEGNITGIVKDGDILFKTNHIQYSQDSVLTFINDFGDTLINILQDCDIGTNVTGIGVTTSGIIELIYVDDSLNIGAQFILYNKPDYGNQADNRHSGFENDGLSSPQIGQYFRSYDFPAQTHYNFSLYKPEDTGNFKWNLYSIPSG